MYQGLLNFIISFYFPILKELIIYVSYCYYILWIGWIIKCLIVIDAWFKHEDTEL